MIASTVERSTQVYEFKTTHPRTAPMYPTIETTTLNRAFFLAMQRHRFAIDSSGFDREEIGVYLLGSPTVDLSQDSAFVGGRSFWDERQGYVSLDMANKSATIITDSGDNSEVYSGVCRSTVTTVLARHDWFLVQNGSWEIHSRPMDGANYCRYRIERGDA